MRKHWVITISLLGILLFFLQKTHRDNRIYLALTRDCSVYKGRDHKEFMLCWRSQRRARYQLKKRLGKYGGSNQQGLVGKDGQGYTTNN